MQLPIYFSHGYREREAVFNKYFGILIEQFQFARGLHSRALCAGRPRDSQFILLPSGALAPI